MSKERGEVVLVQDEFYLCTVSMRPTQTFAPKESALERLNGKRLLFRCGDIIDGSEGWPQSYIGESIMRIVKEDEQLLDEEPEEQVTWLHSGDLTDIVKVEFDEGTE